MKPATLEQYRERMLAVLIHIQKHLDEDPSLEELARVACFSPYHFHRIFRGMVGESVKEHIRRLRLERAAVQLKLTDRPVTDIALEAGYEAHESFTRAFRALMGASPSGFRGAMGRPALAAAPSGVHYEEAGRCREFEPMESGGKTMDVRIKSFDPMRVAFVRHVGPYDQCGAAWEKLCSFLGRRGHLGPNARFYGLCHDDPDVTPPEKIRYDACVAVGESFEPQGEIGVQTIAGGDYAVATHYGPYAKLSESYAMLLGQWLPRSGRALRSAPSFELYVNDPNTTAPEDLVTQIHSPLEPAEGK